MKKTRIIGVTVLAAVILFMFCACSIFGEVGDKLGIKSTVTVTLEPNGGTGIEQLVIKGKSGESMELPTPIREGYTFDKWYDGFNIVSNDVFPEKDTILTARYYAKTDTKKQFKMATELNKEFHLSGYAGVDTWFYFEKDDVSIGEQNYLQFLQNNPNVDIEINMTLEARLSYASMFAGSVEGKFWLTGANDADTLGSSQRIDADNTSYTLIKFSEKAKSSIIIGSEAIVGLYMTTNWPNASIYVRNLKAIISYTEKAGMLV